MSIVLKLARNRRSIRIYKHDSIEIKDILEILETARNAPSGANRQPWRFLIVSDRKTKVKIRRIYEEIERDFHKKAPEWMKKWFKEKNISWEKDFLTDALILLLVFGKSDEPYWIESVWIAIGYILLAIEEKGLGTLTYTPSNTQKINEFLGIPNKYVLQAILPIGFPYKKSGEKDRFPLNEIVYFNSWGIR